MSTDHEKDLEWSLKDHLKERWSMLIETIRKTISKNNRGDDMTDDE